MQALLHWQRWNKMDLDKIGKREITLFGIKMDIYAVSAYFSTFANALCGSIIIFFFAINSPLERTLATRLVVLGASFDAIDGKLARRSNFKFPIGAKLDTYADLVTFGLSPALMLLDMLIPYNTFIGWVTASFYVLTASFRLSRFVISKKSWVFNGMPSPPAAIFIASFYVINNVHPIFVAFSSILVSALMMSSLPFTAMKKIDNPFDLFQFILGILLMLLMTYSPSAWFDTLGKIFAAYIYYFIVIGVPHAQWQMRRQL